MGNRTPKGVADHPAKDQMHEMWADGCRAKEISDWLSAENLPVVSVSTIARYGQRYWSQICLDDARLEALKTDLETIESLELGSVSKISLRKTISKNGDETNYRTIDVAPKTEIPLVSVAAKPRLQIKNVKASKETKPSGWNLGVCLPDYQIGYFDTGDGSGLKTTQDESAIDVAHQIISYLQNKYRIDMLVNLGDTLDFPAFSTYRTAPGYLSTTQQAIDRTAEEACAHRTLAPDARIVWLEGNHDARITNFILDRVPQLVGLKQAGSSNPAISVRSLCKLDDYDIEFVGPFPDGELWVNDHLRFEHGSKYSSVKGGTAAKQLRNGVSVGYGHIHRAELLQETRHTARGPRTHFAGSPGTLARIDGMVPSSSTGITATGTQAAAKHEDWQQGLWVFWWQPGGGQLVSIEPVSIWGGWAMFRGQEFVATCDENGTAI